MKKTSRRIRVIQILLIVGITFIFLFPLGINNSTLLPEAHAAVPELPVALIPVLLAGTSWGLLRFSKRDQS